MSYIDWRQGEPQRRLCKFWQGMGRGGPSTCTQLLGSELFDLNYRFHAHFLFGRCHFGDKVDWEFGKAAAPKATSSPCAHIHPSKTKRPKRGEHWWRSGSQVAILAAKERRVHLRGLFFWLFEVIWVRVVVFECSWSLRPKWRSVVQPWSRRPRPVGSSTKSWLICESGRQQLRTWEKSRVCVDGCWRIDRVAWVWRRLEKHVQNLNCQW